MLASLVAAHPTRTLLPASFALSFLSLSLTPSFVSLILLLTSLLLYTRDATSLSTRSALHVFSIWIALTASISISHLQPSIQALSTPSTSIASLILLSGLSSMVALIPVILRHHIQAPGPSMQILVFPTLWATTWLAISWISPLGRIVTWSSLTGIDSYRWIRTVVGFSGIDWITAAWASVAAAVVEPIVYKYEKEETLLVDIDHDHEVHQPAREFEESNRLVPLAGFLLALTLPSFFVSTLPLSVLSSNTTPLRVACILPPSSEKTQVERFLEETLQYTSQAKIILWPESAVVFETEIAKQEALEQVHELTSKFKVWIGVSFEERISGASPTRDGVRRNGMSLVGPDGVEMTYYKRHLVPIAESFSQISSKEDPVVHTINLHNPKNVPKHEWDPSGFRTIPLSASICLDFSSPLTALSSRPALILAPAKTWHIGIGRAMYELARARGEEIGADVLWCDGGAGGLGGVAGNLQVGSGSWVQIIGVPYPAEERRTLYGICGDWLALAALLGVPGFIWLAKSDERRTIAWVRQHIQGALARIRGARQQEASAPAQSQLLIDHT